MEGLTIPYNGAGVFTRNFSWIADKNSAIPITASRMDADSNDFATGFNNALTRDGQGVATAALPMGGFRHTGVGNGVALNDYAALGQVQNNGVKFAIAGGTADALTATLAPVPVLVDGFELLLRATAANATATPTLALNGGTARTITKLGGAALVANDIVGNLHELILRYNLANTRWELLNAGTNVPSSLSDPASLTGVAAGASTGPTFDLLRNKGSAASANDLLAILNFKGENSTPAAKAFAAILAKVISPTATTEAGELHLQTIIAGALADRLILGAGLYSLNATGGDKGADTANFSSYYLNGVPLGLGFRNWCLNGAMGVWQRGAGGSASIAVAASTTAYTTDRWYLSTLANQASVVSQQAITTLAGTRFAARVQRNSGQTGTGIMVFAQPLDADVISAIVGQTCVLSAQVSTGANWSPTSGTLSYKVYCGTGAVGKRNASAYSGETAPISGSTNIAAGSVVQAITIATGAIPAGTTQMEVQFFWTPVGTASTNDWFQISNIQLEVGSVATAFDAGRQNFVTELAQCQRFYQKSFPYATAPAQSAGTTGAIIRQSDFGQAGLHGVWWNYQTRMRSAPTITTFNPSAANASLRDITAGSDLGAVTISLTGDLMTLIKLTSNGTVVQMDIIGIHAQADADI